MEVNHLKRLTEVSAWRTSDGGRSWYGGFYTQDEVGHPPGPMYPLTGDGRPSSGSRGKGGGARGLIDGSAWQMREIVAYAQERFIHVMPEIEMPGHCCASLAAYPQLCCAPPSSPHIPGQPGVASAQRHSVLLTRLPARGPATHVGCTHAWCRLGTDESGANPVGGHGDRLLRGAPLAPSPHHCHHHYRPLSTPPPLRLIAATGRSQACVALSASVLCAG